MGSAKGQHSNPSQPEDHDQQMDFPDLYTHFYMLYPHDGIQWRP